MEFELRPWVSWSFLQNNNHQAVKKIFHFLNCLMIVVLQKTPWNPRIAVQIPWIRYINLIYIYLLYIYIYIYIYVYITLVTILTLLEKRKRKLNEFQYNKYWKNVLYICWANLENQVTYIYIYIYIYMCMLLGSVNWPKCSPMIRETWVQSQVVLLNTQQYKVRIEGKVEQSRERSSTHPYTLV